MLNWSMTVRRGVTFHVGTDDGEPCAQIRETLKGVGFQFRGQKPDLNAASYRNCASVENAKDICEALSRRPNARRYRETEIMRRIKHA